MNSQCNPLLTLGFSPCPNDTFIFDGLVNGPVRIPGYHVRAQLHDVEILNQMAFDSLLDVTKLSLFAWLAVQKRYRLLSSGGSLVFGRGPVVIAKTPLTREDMAYSRIVLPGRWTTAHLLLRLWSPESHQRSFIAYDRIFEAVQSGEADCGVIIHESRFTYQEAGFHQVVDLGAWWEEQTALPIALGCIAIHRRHPEDLARQVEMAIRRSVRRAQEQPALTLPYIRAYAQEMRPQVLEAHIQTFVNEYSLDHGDAGRAAIAAMETRARQRGLIP